jgi:hypothetical protein
MKEVFNKDRNSKKKLVEILEIKGLKSHKAYILIN